MHIRLRVIIATIVMAFTLAPCFAQEKNAKDCPLDGNQLELNECANERLLKADAEMNRLYTEQISHLNKASGDRLRASQRAWLTYRDKACLYETRPPEESGSIWPMQNALCRELLTKQRNQLLKAYVSCRKNGCPE